MQQQFNIRKLYYDPYNIDEQNVYYIQLDKVIYMKNKSIDIFALQYLTLYSVSGLNAIKNQVCYLLLNLPSRISQHVLLGALKLSTIIDYYSYEKISQTYNPINHQ